MDKPLSEMSMEELWALFPVVLKEYNPVYPVWYEEERRRILETVEKENVFRINHIGSTAVSGLLSKPTVDILLELKPRADVENAIERLKSEWILMSQKNAPAKVVFNKGYTPRASPRESFISIYVWRGTGTNSISATIFANIGRRRNAMRNLKSGSKNALNTTGTVIRRQKRLSYGNIRRKRAPFTAAGTP